MLQLGSERVSLPPFAEPKPWKPTAKHLVQAAAGILALSALDRATAEVLTLLGLKFPSFVAAMIGLFACLALARSIHPLTADRVADFCAPGAAVLSRWMALFFVPPLVLVPLNPAPHAKDLILLVFLGGGGFVASFFLAGSLAKMGKGLRALPQVLPTQVRPAWSARALLLVWGAVLLMSLLGWRLAPSRLAELGLGVSLAVFGFIAAEALRDAASRRGHQVLSASCHPVLLTAIFIGTTWLALGIPLQSYLNTGPGHTTPGAALMLLLRPSVVSLGLALDRGRVLLRTQARALLVATASSAIFSLFVTALAARLLGLSRPYALAIISRSVTTPVALSMAETLGASGGITAMLVILTGVLGAILSPFLSRKFRFEQATVIGIATGCSSHGIGTAALAPRSPVSAAFSGIAFALMAIFSSLLVGQRELRGLLLSLL